MYRCRTRNRVILCSLLLSLLLENRQVRLDSYLFGRSSSDGLPITPCSNLTKVYSLSPLLASNKDKRGLPLDGKLKHEETNLASSTMCAFLSFFDSDMNVCVSLFSIRSTTQKENLDIIVQYKVKVKIMATEG